MPANDNGLEVHYWIVQKDGAIKREVDRKYARDFLFQNPEYGYRWVDNNCFIEIRKEKV